MRVVWPNWYTTKTKTVSCPGDNFRTFRRRSITAWLCSADLLAFINACLETTKLHFYFFFLSWVISSSPHPIFLDNVLHSEYLISADSFNLNWNKSTHPTFLRYWSYLVLSYLSIFIFIFFIAFKDRKKKWFVKYLRIQKRYPVTDSVLSIDHSLKVIRPWQLNK